MVAFPFVYFSLFLSFILYKKKRFDISAYLVSLYVISSFFAIMIDVKNLRSFDTTGYNISIFPAILYCFLLTLTIWPFYRLKTKGINMVRLNKPKLFNFIVYFYFGCFLLLLILFFNTIIQILNGNIVVLRSALSNGETITNINISGMVKPIFIIAGVFGGFSIMMILFYFYSVFYLHRSKLFNLIILLSSMSIILLGIIGVDRSLVTFWMISYGFVLVLFLSNHYTSKKKMKHVLVVSVICLSFVIAYFLMTTFSRFDNADVSSGGSIISYAGQSFVNFCYFFDHDVQFGKFSLQRIFPLFYKLFINNGIENSGQLNEAISLQTGKSIGVFYTFIGAIMVASGKLAAILYCFFFFIISSTLTRFKSRKITYFYQLVLIFCLISVPMLGIFSHFYGSFATVIPLYTFLIYVFHLKTSRNKIKRNNITPFILKEN